MMINIQDDILQLAALGLLDRLLVDKATGGHILWATDAYAHLGEHYAPGDEIRPRELPATIPISSRRAPAGPWNSAPSAPANTPKSPPRAPSFNR